MLANDAHVYRSLASASKATCLHVKCNSHSNNVCMYKTPYLLVVDLAAKIRPAMISPESAFEDRSIAQVTQRKSPAVQGHMHTRPTTQKRRAADEVPALRGPTCGQGSVTRRPSPFICFFAFYCPALVFLASCFRFSDALASSSSAMCESPTANKEFMILNFMSLRSTLFLF